MAKHLEKLRGYEVAVVCDDSGSMNTPLDGSEQTRWDQLRKVVTMVLEVILPLNPGGVDLYFLNREPLQHVNDPAQVQQIFSEPPVGYTPLVPVLEKVFQLPASRRGHDKKLLVFIATDGAPTDGDGKETIDQLEQLMREKRQEETTFVQFLICTDEPYHMDYLTGWDRTMKNVDVTRDFKREKQQIQQCRGTAHPFTMGDYVVKALVGPIVPEVDVLNEGSQ
jgi:hypothetical protein